MRPGHGTLIAIGGREDKERNPVILREVVQRAEKGKLVVTAIASRNPAPLLREYKRVFRELGAREVGLLDIGNRLESSSERNVALLRGASGIFFSGGDQLRITSQLAGSPIFHRIHDIYSAGGLIAGTSAGASVLCSTMLIEGPGQASPKSGGVSMAPGLGLVEDAIIDQHFAARGRMGRLLCAITENPGMLGIGIDEDTAVIFEGKKSLRVMGAGAVYILDGTDLTYSNIAEEKKEEPISIYDVKLHVLSAGDHFDMKTRAPRPKAAGSRRVPVRAGRGAKRPLKSDS